MNLLEILQKEKWIVVIGNARIVSNDVYKVWPKFIISLCSLKMFTIPISINHYSGVAEKILSHLF